MKKPYTAPRITVMPLQTESLLEIISLPVGPGPAPGGGDAKGGDFDLDDDEDVEELNRNPWGDASF